MNFWHSRHGSQIKLSSKELYEISQDISRNYAPNNRTYLTELVLMPVDPFHLYAYWNLGEKEGNLPLKEECGTRLSLRVFWRPDENLDIDKTKLWFDLAVSESQHQKKVPLPIDKTAYAAAIGICNADNQFHPLAYSNTIQVPRGNISQHLKLEQITESVQHTVAPTPHQADIGPTMHSADQTAIDPELKTTLYEKFFIAALEALYGSDKDLDARIIAPQEYLETTHYTSNNASGLGCNN